MALEIVEPESGKADRDTRDIIIKPTIFIKKLLSKRLSIVGAPAHFLSKVKASVKSG
jgi:hypothetical protein